jgi:hypothetical protein
MAVRMPLEQLDYEEIRPSMRCLGCHCREGERDRHLGPSQCSQKSTANSNRRTIFLWVLNRTRGSLPRYRQLLPSPLYARHDPDIR